MLLERTELLYDINLFLKKTNCRWVLFSAGRLESTQRLLKLFSTPWTSKMRRMRRSRQRSGLHMTPAVGMPLKAAYYRSSFPASRCWDLGGFAARLSVVTLGFPTAALSGVDWGRGDCNVASTLKTRSAIVVVPGPKASLLKLASLEEDVCVEEAVSVAVHHGEWLKERDPGSPLLSSSQSNLPGKLVTDPRPGSLSLQHHLTDIFAAV